MGKSWRTAPGVLLGALTGLNVLNYVDRYVAAATLPLLLASLSISVREAIMLAALFWAQFVIGAVVPESWHGSELIVVGVVYLVLAAVILLRSRDRIRPLLRDGFRTPHDALRE